VLHRLEQFLHFSEFISFNSIKAECAAVSPSAAPRTDSIAVTRDTHHAQWEAQELQPCQKIGVSLAFMA
jgi:hypothetical protein